MPGTILAPPSLYAADGARKYLTAAERQRFIVAVDRLPSKKRLFCLSLLWSGARVSEALAIMAGSIDFEFGTVSLETLKRRRPGVIRQVPLPPLLLEELDVAFDISAAQHDPSASTARLWPFSRTSAWRLIASIMRSVGVEGPAASPKGLRHSFGVTAFQAGVPPHLVQRWLGHASLNTTSIYADVSGPEERWFAQRTWQPLDVKKG